MALIQYAKDGDIDDVIRSIEFGVDINIKNNVGWSALHHATSMGHDDIVRLL